MPLEAEPEFEGTKRFGKDKEAIRKGDFTKRSQFETTKGRAPGREDGMAPQRRDGRRGWRESAKRSQFELRDPANHEWTRMNTNQGGMMGSPPQRRHGRRGLREYYRLFAIFGGTERRAGKFQVPSLKLQRNSKAQIPIVPLATPPAFPPGFGPWPKGGPSAGRRLPLKFGVWSCFGIWNLGFEASPTHATENRGEPFYQTKPLQNDGSRAGAGTPPPRLDREMSRCAFCQTKPLRMSGTRRDWTSGCWSSKVLPGTSRIMQLCHG